jgi:subtilisin family serine protease
MHLPTVGKAAMTKQVNRVSAIGATARIFGLVALLCPVGFAAHGADLVIYALSSDPSELKTPEEEGDPTESVVVFNTVVAGTSTPPEKLTLEQNDGNDEFQPVKLPNGADVFLLDDGNGADEVRGDLVYTGTAVVEQEEDDRNIYRATVPSGETSPEYSLEIADAQQFQNPLVPDDDEEIVTDPATGERFVAGELLARFEPDVDPRQMVNILDGDETMAGWEGVLDVAKIEFDSDINQDGVVTPDEKVQAVLERAASLAGKDNVESAEPNRELALDALISNDDELKKQRSLKIVGAEAAWLAAGSVKDANRRDIAVLDSGIDLDGQAERFEEILVHKKTSEDASSGCSRRALQDENGHGTAVAGIVAAVTDGKLLPIRVTRESGRTTTAGIVICALGEVARKRALVRIINLSLGFDNVISEDKNKLLETITSLIADRGVLVVASAGNGQRDGTFERNHYPAAFNDVVGDGLIAVANTRNDDTPHDDVDEGTRRGPWVDLSAPGVRVGSLNLDGEVVPSTGTSMSAALVSGAASLLWSRYPDATAGQIERWLKQGAKPLDPDLGLGAGRLDMAGATLNGSMELVVTPDKGPASWPSKKGKCKVRGRTGDSAFYAPQHGKRFVSCKGEAGIARTQKVIEVPPNTDIARLEFAVRIAAFADAPTDQVRLRFKSNRGNSKEWYETLEIDSGNCDGFEDTSNTRCTDWETAKLVVKNPPAGKLKLTFDAQNPDGGAISLMLDRLETKVKLR